MKSGFAGRDAEVLLLPSMRGRRGGWFAFSLLLVPFLSRRGDVGRQTGFCWVCCLWVEERLSESVSWILEVRSLSD